MGDVAQILRGSLQPPTKSRLSPMPASGASASASAGPPRALAMQSKASVAALEVLRGSSEGGAEDLPPAVPTTVKVGSKRVAVQKACRPWAWAPFCSSSRTDGLMLHHWVRAGVEYPDYPFARFDVHLDPVTYTDEEYEQYLGTDESAHALARDNTGSSDTPGGAGSGSGNRKSGSKVSQTSTSSGSPQNKSRQNKPEPELQQPVCHVAPWTRAETDALLEVCRKYELRWPVIHDRWMSLTAMNSSSANTGSMNSDTATPRATTRSVEELQQRYYAVAAVLMQHRIVKEARAEVQALSAGAAGTPTGVVDASQQQVQQQQQSDANVLLETAAARQLATADPGSQPVMVNFGQGATNKQFFDFHYEQGRRAHWDALWKRTADQDKEEAAIRKELKQVEAQLRKIKKAGGHIVAAKTGGKAAGGDKASTGGGRMSVTGSSRSTTPVPAVLANLATSDTPSPVLDQAFATTAPKPVPQTPYLQSARLVQPATGGAAGLNKTLLQRMETVLAECKVPQPRPTVATKRVCDLYDAVRKQTLTLLILQKQILQREGVLEAKRLKVAKLTGTATATVGSSFSVAMPTEEALLGMAPPPAPVSASAAATAAGRKAGPRPTKKQQQQQGSSTSTGSVSKKKSAPKTAASSSTMDNEASSKTATNTTNATAVRPASQPAGGKQQAAAVKQARKTAPKRKRKADSKSPAPPTVATTAGIAMPTPTSQPSTETASTTALPVVMAPATAASTAPSIAPPVDNEASKGASAKKRARKSL